MRSVAGRVAVSLAVGVCALGLASTEPHERRVARWFGAGAQPALIFAVSVPAELGPEAIDALEPAWRERLAGYGVRFRLPSGPHAVDVEVIGARPRDADAIVGALTVPGKLEFLPVFADTDAARAMYQAVHAGGYPTVQAEVDGWRHDESGRYYEDFYLHAPSIEALETAIAEMQRFDRRTILPPGQRIAYEHVTPWPDAEDPRPFVRTYVVGTEPVLGGANVAHAYTIFDPQTNRPEVLVELDEIGTRRFGDYTSRVAGEKMAIVLDGEVRSAPVIQTAIRGGRSNISMGGTSPDEQLAEAEALAAVLENPAPLPPGITATLTFIEEPSLAVRWGVRLGVAAAAALLAFGLATLIARRTTLAPVISRPTTPRPAAVAVPLVITFGLLALVVVLERVPLPWLADWVPDMVEGNRQSISIVAVGLTPVVIAYFLVELVALIIPSWRARRLGTPVDRRPIDLTVAAVTAGLAVLQAWFIAGWWQTMELDRPALTDTLLVRVTVTLTLVGGVMLLAVIASLITRAGLINGWFALLALDWGRMLVDTLTAPTPPIGLDPTPVALVTMALAALVGVALVTRRAVAPDRRRLPLAGLAPLMIAGNLIALFALPYVGIEDLVAWFYRRSLWFDLALATIIGAVWVAPRRGPIVSSFALSLSVGAVAFFGALEFLLPVEFGLGDHVFSGALLGVALVEVAAGIARTIRMPDGAPLIAVHDVDRADAIKDALDAAEIPAAHGGILARALLRFFGPYLPVVIHVPASRLDEATRVVSGARLPDGQRLAGGGV